MSSKVETLSVLPWFSGPVPQTGRSCSSSSSSPSVGRLKCPSASIIDGIRNFPTPSTVDSSGAAHCGSPPSQTFEIHPPRTTTVACSITFSPSNRVTSVIRKLLVDASTSSSFLNAGSPTLPFEEPASAGCSPASAPSCRRSGNSGKTRSVSARSRLGKAVATLHERSVSIHVLPGSARTCTACLTSRVLLGTAAHLPTSRWILPDCLLVSCVMNSSSDPSQTPQ